MQLRDNCDFHCEIKPWCIYHPFIQHFAVFYTKQPSLNQCCLVEGVGGGGVSKKYMICTFVKTVSLPSPLAELRPFESVLLHILFANSHPKGVTSSVAEYNFALLLKCYFPVI